ncbi:hypothetical protein Btru_061322 [Bulinus truncatus]|nr:hypothetical protein Btru_061322 [Bulinus truncatus]
MTIEFTLGTSLYPTNNRLVARPQGNIKTLVHVLLCDVPDFLTCGFCAKEFLLDNITLFIAHKLGCPDKLQHSPDLKVSP